MTPTLVGYVDRVGDNLYNAMAMCGNGMVLQRYHKRRLPNYGVFDEERYFAAGEAPGLTELGGTMMANTICEDIWVPELVAEAAEMGAQVVFNISASPFHAGKGAEREAMLVRARARQRRVAGVLQPRGRTGRARLRRPQRHHLAGRRRDRPRQGASRRTSSSPTSRPKAVWARRATSRPRSTGEQEVYSAIKLGLRDYVRKNGFSDVVLGLSGGIDSALTAAIAADALGAEHVHGVMMPSRYSSPGSVSDSVELASALGVDILELPIEPAYQALLDTLAAAVRRLARPTSPRRTCRPGCAGRCSWRCRTSSAGSRWRPATRASCRSATRRSYGDMVGGFAPLKDVFKTRVYDLARWRNAQGASRR